MTLNPPPSTLSSAAERPYVGRLAPSPTGLLHLGHARTFWIAAQRARRAGGTLFLRNDDLDRARCRPEFVAAMQEDLRWLGVQWDGSLITQSQRIPRYRSALARLHAAGLIFPCTRSRRDVLEAAGAPHEAWEGLYAPTDPAASPNNRGVKPLPQLPADDEPLYPRTFRPPAEAPLPPLGESITVNWRFRVPDGEIAFNDAALGPQTAIAGRDFGDFLVWRKDDVPSYQLATVVDDIDFGVTEVVRGADLVKSTFRQLLLFGALDAEPPHFFHAPLMLDENGHRLAKRHDALALRTLRERGIVPRTLIEQFEQEATKPRPKASP